VFERVIAEKIKMENGAIVTRIEKDMSLVENIELAKEKDGMLGLYICQVTL
jgi:hypothetical protein